MTENSLPDNQPTGIRLRYFIVVAALVVVIAFVAVWFAIPGPDTQHRLVSPSGSKTIELAELCSPSGCNRVAILDRSQPDGTHMRTGCPLSLPGASPLFPEITFVWSSAEDRVDISYPTGTLTISTAECTRTE